MTSKLLTFFLIFHAVCGDEETTPFNTYPLETNICASFISDTTASTKAQLLALEDVSGGPLPNGLTYGNFYDLGSFDGCRNILNTYNDLEYRGKYCLANGSVYTALLNTTIASILPPAALAQQLKLGICLPDFCTAGDFHSVYPQLSFYEQQCFSKSSDPKLDTKAIIAIAILCVFFALVVVSTVYEATINHQNKKPHHPLFTAFSAIGNTRKISGNSQGQMLCLNGIKAFSIIWIIFYHELVLLRYGSVNNFWEIYSFMGAQRVLWIIQAVVAVDSFFAIGGLVLVYSYMRAADKGVKYNMLMSYVHRYFRVTPVLAAAILIHAGLLIHLGNGPNWNKVHEDMESGCLEYWWTALLYVQNYVNTLQMCVPQTWYLSVDMQLFIIAPIILIPLRRWTKLTLTAMGGFIVAGMVVPFVITYVNDLPASGYFLDAKADLFMSELYLKTHSRFGSYVVGMLTGYFLYWVQKEKREFKLRRVAVLCVWIVVLTSFLTIMLGPKSTIDDRTDIWGHSFYNGLFRVAWAVALCIMIILCVLGYGGPINAILSWNIVQVLGKLTFCMYMVHYSIIILRITSLRETMHFSVLNLAFAFSTDFLFTLFFSYLAHITFELPFFVVEKYFVSFVSNCCLRLYKTVFCKKIIPKQ